MVIICKKYGQLANRLFVFGHFIGNAIEYDYALRNASFDDYAKHFPAVMNGDFAGHDIALGPVSKRLASATRLAAHALELVLPVSPWHRSQKAVGYCDLRNEKFLKAAKSKLVLARGWEFRDKQSFVKHADVLRKIFHPGQVVQAHVENLMRVHRADGIAIVGIHIRRGDYDKFEGGKHLYSDEFYARLMRDYARVLKAQGLGAKFLIFSNVPASPEQFSGVEAVVASGTFMQDLHALGKCDFVIGPPSTFSLWASFFGQTPYLHIDSQDPDLSMDRFAIANG